MGRWFSRSTRVCFAIRSTSRGALSGWCDCGYTPTVYTHGHQKKTPDSDDETVAIMVARLPCVRMDNPSSIHDTREPREREMQSEEARVSNEIVLKTI